MVISAAHSHHGLRWECCKLPASLPVAPNIGQGWRSVTSDQSSGLLRSSSLKLGPVCLTVPWSLDRLFAVFCCLFLPGGYPIPANGSEHGHRSLSKDYTIAPNGR
jgi:hypothetical protein